MKAKIIKDGDDMQEYGYFLLSNIIVWGQAGEAGVGELFLPYERVKDELRPKRTDTELLDTVESWDNFLIQRYKGKITAKVGSFMSDASRIETVRDLIHYIMDMQE